MEGNPTPSDTREETLEPNNLDIDKDQRGSIFFGFAGLLAILLLITVFCVLWNWNKWKKRQVPYLQVTIFPLLSLPRQRQRAKNIYDLLPRRQEDLGRHSSRNVRIFSTASLLSRNTDSPASEYVAFPQAGSALQPLEAQVPAVGHVEGISDNAMEPQMCGSRPASVHNINVRPSRDCSSTSSEDSGDYVNVPTAEKTAETLASTRNAFGSLFVLPHAQELEFTEEMDQDCENGCDCINFWSPGADSSDSSSDGEGSSQSSNDYVNTAGLDLGVNQEKQPWVTFQHCRDYVNVSPTDPNGSQQQTEEEVTVSNTDQAEVQMDTLETHVQLVMQSGKFLASGDHMNCQPPAQEEHSPMKYEEEPSNESSNDYENVLVTKLGDKDTTEGYDTWPLPHESRSSRLLENHVECSMLPSP